MIFSVKAVSMKVFLMLRRITISYSTYGIKCRNNLVQDKYSKNSNDAVDIYSLNENKVLWKTFARKVPWALNVLCPLDRGRRKIPQNILAFWNLGTKKWKSRVIQVQTINCIFLKKNFPSHRDLELFHVCLKVINLDSKKKLATNYYF